MPEFSHEVPKAIRTQSTWDDAYAVWTAPDGRRWISPDDPYGEHVSH